MITADHTCSFCRQPIGGMRDARCYEAYGDISLYDVYAHHDCASACEATFALMGIMLDEWELAQAGPAITQ